MSKAQSAESPKRDSTKKPVFEKFGNLFNSSKKRYNKPLSDSPTSPTNDRTSKAAEKEPVKERKRAQISVTSGIKVHNAGGTTVSTDTSVGQVLQQDSKEATLPATQSENDVTSGKSDHGLPHLHPSGVIIKTTTVLSASENSARHTNSETSQKPAQSPSARPDKQSSSDRNVRHLAFTPGRRNSASEGETVKASPRKLQVYTQDNSISKEDSSRVSQKKSTKFTINSSESKTDKVVQALDNTESSKTAKLSLQVASGNNIKDQDTVTLELSHPHVSTIDSNSLDGVISSSQSPPEHEIETGSPHKKLDVHNSSETLCGAKVLAFDIYLSKTAGTNSPAPVASSSNGETMQKSPNSRKSNRRRRSLKSQTSQNEEKKTENAASEPSASDTAFSFEGVIVKQSSPESKINSVPMSPETSFPLSAKQNVKAVSNHKLSPRGDTDKSKQELPASSPLRKKKENQSGSVPASPTARKAAQGKDSLLKNQPASPAKATEGNQPIPVSTTKEAYVEKVSVPGSSAGRGGEECVAVSCETSEDCSSTAAAAFYESSRTQEESHLGAQTPQTHNKANLNSPTQSSSDVDKKLKTSESSKSIVTSKLSIPPKSKNVELPIKPKVPDSLESIKESSTEQPIHKGNTANKISLFETKKTSQKQIDFYATKSISQPKKFVERAKLNFGKNSKGTVQKDSNSTSKQTIEHKIPDTSKLENVPSELKANKEIYPADSASNKRGLEKREDTAGTFLDQVQMEESKQDLNLVAASPEDKTESNVQTNEDKLTECTVVSEAVALPSINTDTDKLPHTSTNSSIAEETTQLPDKTSLFTNSVNSEVDLKDHIDMGNVNINNSVEEQSVGTERGENKDLILNADHASLYSDNVDSPLPVSSVFRTDQVQFNGNNELTDPESEPPTAHSLVSSPGNLRKSQAKNYNKKIQSKEPTTSIAKKDKQTREKIQPSDAEQSIFELQHDLKNELMEYKEGLEHTKQCIEQEEHPNSLLQAPPNEDACHPYSQESESLSVSGVLNVISNIQSDTEPCATDGVALLSEEVTSSIQSPAVRTIELNGESNKNNAFLESLSSQREVSTPHASTSIHESSVSLDESGSHEKNPASFSNNNDTGDNTKQMSCILDIPQQEGHNTIIRDEINDITLSPEAAETEVYKFKGKASDFEIECASELQEQQEESSLGTSQPCVNEDKIEFSDPTIGISMQQMLEKSSNIDLQGTTVFTEADVNLDSKDYSHSSNSEETEILPSLNSEEIEIKQSVNPEEIAITSSVNPEDTLCKRDDSDLPSESPSDSISSVHANVYVVDTQTTPHRNNSLQNVALEKHFKNIERSPETSLNASIANEDSILDSSSDMEQFAETIRQLNSPITLPQKRKTPRAAKSPGPFYGLPPIHEDFLEKILDTESFSFGLGRKEWGKQQAPLSLFKMKSKETAEKLKPNRASAAEQSMLLKSLITTRETPLAPQETCDKENADVTDLVVKKSRIDSLYSSRKSPFASLSEENVFSPSVTTVNSINTSFATFKKDSASSGKNLDPKTIDSAKSAQTSVKESIVDGKKSESLNQESSANLHTDFTNLQISSNMEKHLEADNITQVTTKLSDVKLSPDINISTPDGVSFTGAFLESTPKSDALNCDNIVKDFSDIFYFKEHGQIPNHGLPNVGVLEHPGKGTDKINPRPGKMVIFTEPNFGGTMIEVFNDVPDCTSWKMSPSICVKTVRGCWILYELPNFEGRSIPLEEGVLELTNPWSEESQEENTPVPTVIGSLRHVVKDYRVCQIDLFTDPDGLGVMTSYFDDTEELQVYGRLQRTCSIKVHWGVWLIYEEPGFQGIPYIIEPGEYPNLLFWNTEEAFIGSLRPLKMGSRKVEIPYEPKIIIYEKVLFEGRCVELDKEVLKLGDLEYPEVSEEEAVLPFTNIGSIRVLSGLWVGYEKPEFEGHQYLLEEGDYEMWNQWGGYDGLLQSLRPILSDFSSPSMTMYSEKDFDEKGSNINVLGIISNMDETGFGGRTQSINVTSGVWVAYETPDFTGEQYILEKGMYSHFGAWGAKDFKISSVQPIFMDAIENPRGHFRVELFSEPDFKGISHICEGDTRNIEDSFTAKSCKVTAGRWAAYDKEDFSGNLWVLEEGSYSSLCAMGCQQDTSIRSLKVINYEFSEPSIVLYGKENFQGRKVKLTTEITNLQTTGYSPDLLSVEVIGGIWVLYEYINYRGHQIFLLPGKIAEWHQYSGWNKIGSLRPLRQKRLYFKLRNKASGMLMSTNGNLDDIKLLRIQVMEDTGAEDQIWAYQEGTIRCRIAEDCSLATSGSLVTNGSKLGLTLDQTGASIHWNINPDGRIYNRSKPNLVLDIKGGTQYDQQHLILNSVTEGKLTQLWEVCIL
ncbi:beta/gamma crystallin domain-containing protein 1 [Rhinophrynus dorsalis]